MKFLYDVRALKRLGHAHYCLLNGGVSGYAPLAHGSSYTLYPAEAATPPILGWFEELEKSVDL